MPTSSPDDDWHYRVAIIEAFRKRGIYPRELRVVSEKALRWPNGDELDQPARDAIEFAKQLRPLLDVTQKPTRKEIFELAQKFQGKIHELLASKMDASVLGNFER